MLEFEERRGSQLNMLRPKTPRTFTLKEGTTQIGLAVGFEGDVPFPFFYLKGMKVRPEFEHRSYGKQIVEYLKKSLAAEGRIGILLNEIDKQSPARRMYEKADWTLVPKEAIPLLMRFDNEWRMYRPCEVDMPDLGTLKVVVGDCSRL